MANSEKAPLAKMSRLIWLATVALDEAVYQASDPTVNSFNEDLLESINTPLKGVLFNTLGAFDKMSRSKFTNERPANNGKLLENLDENQRDRWTSLEDRQLNYSLHFKWALQTVWG